MCGFKKKAALCPAGVYALIRDLTTSKRLRPNQRGRRKKEGRRELKREGEIREKKKDLKG
jgi:hypothetical protein